MIERGIPMSLVVNASVFVSRVPSYESEDLDLGWVRLQQSIPRQIFDPSRIGNQLKETTKIIIGQLVSSIQDTDRIIRKEEERRKGEKKEKKEEKKRDEWWPNRCRSSQELLCDQCHLPKVYEMQTQGKGEADENLEKSKSRLYPSPARLPLEKLQSYPWLSFILIILSSLCERSCGNRFSPWSMSMWSPCWQAAAMILDRSCP